MIPIEEREKLVLKHLFDEGYLLTKNIVRYIKTISERGSSIENMRKLLQHLREQKLIANKVLSDTKEHVYFITKQGLKTLDKTSQEINRFKKNLGKVHINHVHHYWLVREFEEKIKHDSSHYKIRTLNEFQDEQNWLYEKMNTVIIKSDGELKIYKDDIELICLRLEMDTGTESISTIIKKFDGYSLYFNSNFINKHETYPVILLFITPEQRIPKILKKLGNHKIKKHLIFLPLEYFHSIQLKGKFAEQFRSSNLEKDTINMLGISSSFTIQESKNGWIIKGENFNYIVKPDKKNLCVYRDVNIFSDSLCMDSQGNIFSLLSLVLEREGILTFRYSIQQASLKKPAYDIFIRTLFSTPYQDPFFPVMLNNTLWHPHGYIKIRKKQQDGNFQDILFVLIFCIENSHSPKQDFMFYEHFLSSHSDLEKLVELPVYYGCLFITKKSNFSIKSIIEKSKLQECIRSISYANCTPEKVLDKNVWKYELSEGFLSFFK